MLIFLIVIRLIRPDSLPPCFGDEYTQTQAEMLNAMHAGLTTLALPYGNAPLEARGCQDFQ